MKLKYGPYSPSRLNTADCPYSFYRQYVDPDRNKNLPENLPQARGSALHEVYEVITSNFINERPTTQDEINALVAGAVQRHPAAYPEVSEIIKMAQSYIRRPPKVLTKDASIEMRLAIRFGDHGFEECSYDDPEAFARGRNDIMMISDDTTEAIIYDHKTQPNIEDADTFQMGFYAWMTWRTYPFLQKITTILHFARYGSYRSFEWSKEDLEAVEQEVMTRVAIIEGTEKWSAVPHVNCQYCPFRKECPVLTELMEFNEVGSLSPKRFLTLAEGGTQQAVKFAGYISVLEDLLDMMKKELKHFVSTTSAVAIPGKVYEFRGKEDVDWKKVNGALKNKAYEVFEKHGIDSRRFMGFSQTFTKDLYLAENAGLIEELNNLFPRKTSTEFRGYKL